MSKIKTISSTEARNNFFTLLDASFRDKQGFLVEKNSIPMAYIIPTDDGWADNNDLQAEKDKSIAAALAKLDTLRAKLPQSNDSIDILRKQRSENAS